MQAGSERMIIQEFKACTQRLRKGVLVQPYIANIFQWQVTMMPHTGYFQDRILTCVVLFKNFPVAVPKVIFQPGTMHPLIDPTTNQFDCSEMFSEWNVSLRVYTLINFIFDSFLEISIPSNLSVPDLESASLIKQGGNAFQNKALKSLCQPPDPSEKSELNIPKRWGNQKERIAHVLVANIKNSEF